MKSLSKSEFFNSYFIWLESQEIESVILHTYENYPAQIHSDIDYCVSQKNLDRIVPLVHEHCKASGWLLVQVMQHEVKAFFCICVSRDNPNCFVQLDACSDYMREGKVLIKSNSLLKNRRKLPNKHFYVPSLEAEFCYTLWKAVAKKKGLDSVVQRLNDLYQNHHEACVQAMLNCGVVRDSSLAHSWKNKSQVIYDDLLGNYDNLKFDSRWNNWMRLLQRLVKPSGLLIVMNQGSNEELVQMPMTLGCSFRKVEVLGGGESIISSYKKILRSTVIIFCHESTKSRLLLCLSKIFDAGVFIESAGEIETAQTIHEYLGVRLVRRWGLE